MKRDIEIKRVLAEQRNRQEVLVVEKREVNKGEEDSNLETVNRSRQVKSKDTTKIKNFFQGCEVMERTLTRKRSYAINFRNRLEGILESLDFIESSPVTLTVQDKPTGETESYIRMMGKMSGKTGNLSMTLALGVDIGELYGFGEAEKTIINLHKGKIEVRLLKKGYSYSFTITPGIDSNKTYFIRKNFSTASTYTIGFSSYEIILLEEFGFKPETTVTLTPFERETGEELPKVGLNMGKKNKFGKKYYNIRLLLPSELVERCKFRKSEHVCLAVEPEKITMYLTSPKNPLQKVSTSKYYFEITPLDEQEEGIDQKLLNEVNRFYSFYIGYEFERINQKILVYLFPGTEIRVQKELVKDIKGEEVRIRPDATVRQQDSSMIFIDFKKSVGAIRESVLDYLLYYPKAQLVLCFLEKYGWSWKEKHVKNILKKKKIKEAESEELLKRITFLHSEEIGDSLPEEVQKDYIIDIERLRSKIPENKLDTLVKCEEELKGIVERLLESGIPREEIDKINIPSKGIYFIITNLLVLENLFLSDYLTSGSLAEVDFIQSVYVSNKRFLQLMELGLVKRKLFRIGVRNEYYYYYYGRKPPQLIDILDPLASEGMQILVKSGRIENAAVSIDDLKELFDSWWLTGLKLLSIMNDRKKVTIEELMSIEEFDNETYVYYALNTLQKLGLVSHCRIFRDKRDQKVVYYITSEFPDGLYLMDQIPYLYDYQQEILKEFIKNGIIIPRVTSFTEWLGIHWLLSLKICYSALKDDSMPRSRGKNIILLELKDLCKRMDEPVSALRTALKNLHDAGVLDQYPWFDKSYYFQISGTDIVLLTDNPLLPNEMQEFFGKIESILEIRLQNLSHIRELMTVNWKASMKVYMTITKYDQNNQKKFSRKELTDILKKEGMVLKTNLTLSKYIAPLKEVGLVSTSYKDRFIHYQRVKI
ncbi:MAG: hypothetical protein ACXAEU_11390 [Candidatus Hodarchaeales archaeon]